MLGTLPHVYQPFEYSLVRCLFRSFGHFLKKLDYLTFLPDVGALYIFWIQALVECMFYKYLLSSVLPFHFLKGVL